MKLSMTYSVKTKRLNHIFMDTVRLYRQAVSFFYGRMPAGMEYCIFRERPEGTGQPGRILHGSQQEEPIGFL